MLNLMSRLAKGIEIAAVFVARERAKRPRFNPQVNPHEVWAGVSFDSHTVIDHRLVHHGQGLQFKNQLGQWTEVKSYVVT